MPFFAFLLAAFVRQFFGLVTYFTDLTAGMFVPY